MRDIVAKCLVKDANKRPTAAQLLEHKFFKAGPRLRWCSLLPGPLAAQRTACAVPRPVLPPCEARGLICASPQTAHESSYLVKHLLADLPPVTERVKLMRRNQAPQSQSENRQRLEQSNVRTRLRQPRAQRQQLGDQPRRTACDAGAVTAPPGSWLHQPQCAQQMPGGRGVVPCRRRT